MNLLCSAVINGFWRKVFEEVEAKSGVKPVYWVGSFVDVEKIEGCYFHDVWEAFSLEGGVDGWESEQDSFNINDISRTEYYNYLKILDRVDFEGFFSFSERDDLFKRQLSYWYYVLKEFKVGMVFFSNAPHLPYDYPLYLCAKKLGLEILMFNVSSLRGWHYLTREIGGEALVARDAGFNHDETIALYKESIEKYSIATYQDPWYMTEQDAKQKSKLVTISSLPYFAFFYFLLKKIKFKLNKKMYDGSFSSKLSSFKFYDGVYAKKNISVYDAYRVRVSSGKKKRKLKREYERFSNFFDPFDIGPYIYFPMHYQPELTTTPLGNDASDQFYVIRELSRSLPAGFKLIVKEHPSQFSHVLYGEQGRYVGCWELISNLNNVVLADLSISSVSLIHNSRAVVTITGTAGWEALVNGKPCLHFGEAWYQEISQSSKINFSNIKTKISEALIKENCSRLTVNDLIENFAKKAINVDIHDALGDDISRSTSVTADYILRSIL